MIMGTRNNALCLSILLLAITVTVQVWAGPSIQTSVKTILASQGKPFIDPQLLELVQELQSVFRYSSYELLSQDSLNLKLDRPGRVSLPGGRVLKITPKGIAGNRATLKLEILKRNRQVFNTVIKLRNGSSITVGGPKHRKGYLLFNISISF